MKLTEAKQPSFTNCKRADQVLKVWDTLHIQLQEKIETLYF